MKCVLVTGAGGFIGGHLARRLVEEGFIVRGVDIKLPEFCGTACHEFQLGDLRDPVVAARAVEGVNDIYQLAADMGGAGYIFTGENDARVMYNSALINLNIVEAARRAGVGRLFYSSSACIYPKYNQDEPENPRCSEVSAYPAAPDSEYGWEKLFSERLYAAYGRNHEVAIHVARFHNIYGPNGTWRGGREKAPAAICRKVAEAMEGDHIEVWGDGRQTRSFLYIDECLEGVRRMMESKVPGPLNIGSEEMVTVNQLAAMVIEISGKRLGIRHVEGPQGVRGRNSDNRLIAEVLDWKPTGTLRRGLEDTYAWVYEQVHACRSAPAPTMR